MRDYLLVTDLAARAGKGDKRAWDALVERYSPADLVDLPQAPAGRRRCPGRKPEHLATARESAG